jgi:hypothetical protein
MSSEKPEEVRDVVKEGKDIKEELTKQTAKSADLQFKSLAESTIPGLNLRKILGNHIHVTFVPDFYFLLKRSSLMIDIVNRSKIGRRNEEINSISFILYISYCGIYRYLKAVDEVNPNNTEIVQKVIRTFESCGYDNAPIPNIFLHWFEGIARFDDPHTKKVILPFLDNIVTEGNYFDNYFFSPQTAHLLPNFRVMLAFTLYLNGRIPGIAPARRTQNYAMGATYADVALLGQSYQARTNARKIPGCTEVLKPCLDTQLLDVMSNIFMNRVFNEPLERYLQLDRTLLTHLRISNAQLMQYLDHTVIPSSPNTTSPSATMALREEPIQPIAVPAFHANAADGPPQIPELNIVARPSYLSRIIAKTHQDNGVVDYNSQVPLVRLASNDSRIVIANADVPEIQHEWFTQSIEHHTDTFDLTETNSFFGLKTPAP